MNLILRLSFLFLSFICFIPLHFLFTRLILQGPDLHELCIQKVNRKEEKDAA
jgi:hypothetical protein